MSIIIRKSIHHQLQNYLKENGILCSYQPSFRANVSTNSRLVHTEIIMLDLQKAFYTLDHILLKKMMCLGFKTLVIKWFDSYLSNRNVCFGWLCFLWSCNFKLWQYFGTTPDSTIFYWLPSIIIRNWLLSLWW